MSGWQPDASIKTLRARAQLLSQIRCFFDQRGVLEVETPLMMRAQACEPHLQAFTLGEFALQTSPESAMKRLLAAGSGPIFQLCKAFRFGEQGHKHNPEFTMLEWYRPGFSFEAIIQETLAIIELVLGECIIHRYRYHDVFYKAFGINPHVATLAELKYIAEQHVEGCFEDMSHSDYLDLLMSCVVEPEFDANAITVITDFPACQAAMAKLENTDSHSYAKRFEAYYAGLELANGYDELCDATELASRMGDTDPHLIGAMQAGLPECCGVALGIDRLMMAKMQERDINKVLSFGFTNA